MDFNKNRAAVFVLALLVVLGTIWYLFRFMIWMELDPKRAAIAYCTEQAKESLNDPSSAQLDPLDSFTALQRQKRFTVKGGMRARNGFNALVWTELRCEIRQAKGSFVLDDLSIRIPE